MVCLSDPLVHKISDLYEKISKLDNLNPSEDVNVLFTDLVLTCLPPYPVDVTKLCTKIQNMRTKLIRLCGQAEGLLEKHYSTILGSYEKPLDHLELFPYYSNYIKLGQLEFELLTQHSSNPTRIAFVGSGPLPLTSIVLATRHLTFATFHNYDIDASANSLAMGLVKSDSDLSERMIFHTNDIMNVSREELKSYDVVFLAALVGMAIEDKMNVIEFLAENMAPGAILMLRSAHGARAFLYPVVDPRDLRGFNVFSVYHPTDDVVNSVVVASKKVVVNMINSVEHHQEQVYGALMLCSKCGELNPHGHMNIEELAIDDHIC